MRGPLFTAYFTFLAVAALIDPMILVAGGAVFAVVAVVAVVAESFMFRHRPPGNRDDRVR